MLTYKICFIRHGLTQANFERRYIGVTDPPLCEAGMRQLSQLREECEYPRVQQVFSSPLRRALQTAEILFPDTPCEICPDLQELNFGAFENRVIEDLEKDESFLRWIAAPEQPTPGGESGVQAAQRAANGLASVFAQMMRQKVYNAAVVTHGGIMASLLSQMGLPQRDAVRWQCGPGEGYMLLLTPQMWMRDQKFEIYAKVPAPAAESAEQPLWQELWEQEEEALDI